MNMGNTAQQDRRPASLSLDLDDKWAYLRAAGRDDWEHRPGYLPEAINHITRMLGERNLPLTVFVVGRDLADPAKVDAIKRFGELSDHEFANHSLNHLPWMHTMPGGQIDQEITVTHERIIDALGERPVGFRGPGFSCPDTVLDVLQRSDYRYDASVFPTSVAPLARAFFLLKTDLKGEQREKAKKLYGGFDSMRQPNRPYERTIVMKSPAAGRGVVSGFAGDGGNDNRVADASLWEIPVTVMPWTRLPVHMSYLVYLASFSELAAKLYFRKFIRLCRWTQTPPSLLLHPPDFLGGDEEPDLAYLPGMKMRGDAKRRFVGWALDRYAENFDVRTMISQLSMSCPIEESPSIEPASLAS